MSRGRREMGQHDLRAQAPRRPCTRRSALLGSVKAQRWLPRCLSHAGLVFSLLYCAAACDPQAPYRACDPSKARGGCAVGEKCALAPSGLSRCYPVAENETRPLGALCEDPRQCALGLSCVELNQVSRCLPICKLNRALGESGCLRRDEAGEAIGGSEYARCLSSLPQQDDLGLCALPCRPWVTEDCALDPERPEAFSCALDAQAPYALCAPTGTAREGASCGSELRCEAGLSCQRDGDLFRCAKLQDFETACPDETQSVRTQGAIDPWSGYPYQACWSCARLPHLDPTLSSYRLCQRPSQAPSRCAPGTYCRCESWDGRPLTFEDAPRRALLDQLRSLLGAEHSVWVGATREEETWRWPSGDFVDPALWAEGEPREGLCAALSLQSGGLESRDCDDALSLLCLEGRSE